MSEQPTSKCRNPTSQTLTCILAGHRKLQHNQAAMHHVRAAMALSGQVLGTFKDGDPPAPGDCPRAAPFSWGRIFFCGPTWTSQAAVGGCCPPLYHLAPPRRIQIHHLSCWLLSDPLHLFVARLNQPSPLHLSWRASSMTMLIAHLQASPISSHPF